MKTDNIDQNEMDSLLTGLNDLIKTHSAGKWQVLNSTFNSFGWNMTAYDLRRLIIRYMNTMYDPRTEDNLND